MTELSQALSASLRPRYWQPGVSNDSYGGGGSSNLTEQDARNFSMDVHENDGNPDFLLDLEALYPSPGQRDAGVRLNGSGGPPGGFLPAADNVFGLSPRDLLPDDLPSSIKCLFIVTYVVIMLLSVLGNLLVIIIIANNAKMRTVTNTFLVSLAVSDLLIAILNMPFQLKFYVQNEWTLGLGLCKFTKYIQGVVIVASIFTLTGIALDRYYAICNPLRARHVHTTRRAFVLIAVFWAAAFILVCPQLLIQRLEPLLVLHPTFRQATVCVEYFHDHRLNIAYTLFFYLVLYLAPVITMFATYGKIAHTLWRRGPIGETPENPHDPDRRLREKKKIVRMLIVIVVLFAVSWFPFFTCQVYMLFHSTHSDVLQGPDSLRVLTAFFQLFGYSNCCINPIIYCFLNDSFQQHFFRTLCCRCFLQRVRVRRKDRRGSAHEFDKLHGVNSMSLTRQSTLYQNSTSL